MVPFSLLRLEPLCHGGIYCHQVAKAGTIRARVRSFLARAAVHSSPTRQPSKISFIWNANMAWISIFDRFFKVGFDNIFWLQIFRQTVICM
jgi:hypothetical protein